MSEVIVDVPTRYKGLPIEVMDELVSLKEENVRGPVMAKHSNHYSALYCMADDEEREEVVQSLAAVCYNYGISVDEIAGEMTKLTLLNEPKKRNRFIMLPKEEEC
jgi:hypothetical protein